MKPITYPARPVNGGPFDKARPKPPGVWYYSPKYNGWRALVHVPTRTVFNRKGEMLSIGEEFGHALRLAYNGWIGSSLSAAGCEWIDCEGLERRHDLGRGTLIVLDAVLPNLPYEQRKDLLRQTFGGPLNYDCRPCADFLHVADVIPGHLNYWNRLKELNALWGCEFYEGVVAKQADSSYPIQLRSQDAACPWWIKHRWAF